LGECVPLAEKRRVRRGSSVGRQFVGGGGRAIRIVRFGGKNMAGKSFNRRRMDRVEPGQKQANFFERVRGKKGRWQMKCEEKEKKTTKTTKHKDL